MKKYSYLKIILAFLFIILFSHIALWSTPAKNVSWLNQCYYKIVGKKSDNTTYFKDWTLASNCDTWIDFTTLWVPDGTYTVFLKWNDNTATWDPKSFDGEPAVDPTNKYGITSWPNALDPNETYKVDTTAPTCILKEIRFLSGFSDNQYYNSWKFYYKWVAWSGAFEVVIESDDTSNWANTNVAKIKEIQFPTLLWATPTTQTFTNSGKVTVVWKYIWSWNNTDNYDILNNATKKFCYDNSLNASSLTGNAGTKLIFQDGNHVLTGITSLILTPDTDVPTVWASVFNQFTNGITFKSWNDGLWADLSIFAWASVTNAKYFSALNNRQITLPNFRDVDSWLKSFNIKIEKHDAPSVMVNYARPLTNDINKITDLTNLNITHDFSLVDNDYNGTSWYRTYSWTLDTLDLSWSIVESNKICDMVWNCVDVDTPEFKVVSNEPIIASNTDLFSWVQWSKHNLDGSYSWNSLSMRSNLNDTHTTITNFEDKYWNTIVPVNGAKDVKLNLVFNNSLWCDQYNAPNDWDCVDIKIKNNNQFLNWIINPAVNEHHNYNYTLNNYNQFVGWNLKLELTSAVPTKDEYKLFGDTASLYGSLPAKLQLLNLKIEVEDKTLYGWLGENGGYLELANSASNKPDYKWFPVINYNYIDDIFPLVEWQQKTVKIANIVSDSNLDWYKLETEIGTNNLFLHFTGIYLTAWNTLTGSDNYDILKNIWFATGYGNWEINYTANDMYNFLPKTIGWISGTNTKFALTSRLNYKVWTKYALIPGIQSWFKDFGPHFDGDFLNAPGYADDSNVTLAEIDVRWKTQTRNDGWIAWWTWAVTTTSNLKDYSTISLYDIKTEINKNVDNYLNGLNRNTWIVAGWVELNLTSFTTTPANTWLSTQNWQILYFKDTDVTINCSWDCDISGKKTVIVENGNIFVKSNMKYNNNNSIIWFILIGNKDSGSKSQFRVSNNITNWVWVIYSDWPVISVDNSNNIIYDGSSVPNTKLANQLYWKWSFATRNTVGWAIKNNAWFCPYGTPDYKKTSCTIEKAQWYDLIYLRRYTRMNANVYGVTNNPMWDGKVPANIDVVSVKTIWWDSYSQVVGWISNLTTWTLPKPSKMNLNAPMIIEYDSKLQSAPPLCF